MTNCSSSGAGTSSPPAGDVSYLYDSFGRLSSVIDWNSDAFTYAYDCTGNVLWMLETPSSAIPTISPCQGSGGTAPSAPTTAPSGSTYVLTTYGYSAGSSGDQLISKTTTALGTGSPTALLAFSSLTYDVNGNLSSSTPVVNGTAQTADAFTYDSQQRVATGPEAGVSSRSYNYTNNPGSGFASGPTVDGMGINAVSGNGTFSDSYDANGELCWIVSGTGATSNTCSSPTGSTAWEGFTYDASGDRTATSAHNGYGSTSTLTWNQDTGTMGCINTNGTSCTTPSSLAPQTATYTYNANRLRMSATTWNSSSSSTQTVLYTWNQGSSALLSDGNTFYIYGMNANVPIAQIGVSDSVSSELLTDTNSNIRGVVEVSSSATSPYALANYTDYDSYGNPTTGSNGSVNVGGLTTQAGSDVDSATRFGFGGGYEDATGLVYLINRYYDSATGQFVNVDPKLQSTQTAYSYGSDSPTFMSDPLGLNPIRTDGNSPSTTYAGFPAYWAYTGQPFYKYFQFIRNSNLAQILRRDFPNTYSQELANSQGLRGDGGPGDLIMKKMMSDDNPYNWTSQPLWDQSYKFESNKAKRLLSIIRGLKQRVSPYSFDYEVIRTVQYDQNEAINLLQIKHNEDFGKWGGIDDTAFQNDARVLLAGHAMQMGDWFQFIHMGGKPSESGGDCNYVGLCNFSAGEVLIGIPDPGHR